MGETSTTAMLVGTRDMFADRSPAVTATLSRDEIEAALSMDPPADLILEVLRPSEAAGEKHSVYVTWERTDLESVLRDPGGDAITFSFDPAELERALDAPDVEGHGLRETAVVLSIAAAAAVGVSNASAEPGGAVYSPNQVTVSGHDEATLAARGIEPGTLAAVHDEATLTARGVEPATLAAASGHDEATLTARGVEPGALAAASSGHDEATLPARGVEPATLAAVHDEATLTARGVEPASPQVVSDTGGGFELPSVDSGTVAGVAGGLAGAGLLIAAAAFATTRRRDPEQFA